MRIGRSGWGVGEGFVELFRVCATNEDAFWSMNGEACTLVITQIQPSTYGSIDRLVVSIVSRLVTCPVSIPPEQGLYIIKQMLHVARLVQS
jgi:hypothetical protein